MNLNNDVSHVNTEIMNVNGDAGAQSLAAGNVVQVLTMNDTTVHNNQISSGAIAADLNANVKNVAGGVGLTSQAVCNSADVSTDPTTTDITSNQECHGNDPSALVNATVQNVGGDFSVAGSALGNTFSSDSNAPNMPVTTNQLNTSAINATVNTNVYGVAGTASVTGSAIGNNAQIVHYSTGN